MTQELRIRNRLPGQRTPLEPSADAPAQVDETATARKPPLVLTTAQIEPGPDPPEPIAASSRPVAASDPGETAWSLAEPLPGPSPGLGVSDRTPDQAAPRADEPLPFPAFPGMGAEEEPPSKGLGIDLERLARGVLKRLWIAIIIAGLVSSLFVVAAVTMVESRWQAFAAVMLYAKQEEFSLGSAKSFAPRSYSLKTLLDTIKLPSSLEAVIAALELDAPIRALSPAIGVNVGRDSDIFQISAIWSDPVTAARIANTVVEHLVERSRDLRRADAEAAHANYSAQLDAAREDLRQAITRMRAFKSTHQVDDLTTETEILLGNLSQLETERETKVAKLQAYEEALVDLQQMIEQEPEMLVSSTIYRNPLKIRLTDYEWELQEARSRYTEKNPKVIKLQSRVDVLKQMIEESEDQGAPENVYTANIKRADLQTRQRELVEDIRVETAEIEALQGLIEQGRAKLASLNLAEKEYKLLQVQVAAAENLVASLNDRVDEAMVMIRRNEATLELLEPALPPTLPLPSSKKLIAMAGVVLGGGLGLGVILLLELLDGRLRTRREALFMPGVEMAWEYQRLPPREAGLVDPRRPTDPVADLFRRLINELDTQLELEDWRCLGILSADPQVGRSLIATNLALTLALKERSVILLDADLREQAGTRPSQLLGLDTEQVGLWQVLDGERALAGVLTDTGIAGLTLLPLGTPSPRRASAPAIQPGLRAATAGEAPTPLHQAQGPAQPDTEEPDPRLAILGGRQFGAILESLRETGRHLIVDLPMIGAQEPLIEAAVTLGSVLLVARSGQTTRRELRETAELLQERGARVCGILVTDVPRDLLNGKPLFRPTPRSRLKLRRPRHPAAAPTTPG